MSLTSLQAGLPSTRRRHRPIIDAAHLVSARLEVAGTRIGGYGTQEQDTVSGPARVFHLSFWLDEGRRQCSFQYHGYDWRMGSGGHITVPVPGGSSTSLDLGSAKQQGSLCQHELFCYGHGTGAQRLTTTRPLGWLSKR